MTAYVFKKPHYWKYQYKDWTQPVLTSDGVIGGNSFATSQTSFTETGLEAFRAFDGNTSTMCYFTKSTGYFQWYNPTPLKITNLKLTNFAGDAWGTRALTSGSIQVSNNGSDFVELKTFTNSTTGGGASWNIDLSSNTGYYKYYRIICTGTSYANAGAANQCHIAELKITATEQIIVKGSSTNYDFRTSKDCVLKRKQYWKKVVTEITKHWKEIVTETTVRELAFACYGLQHIKLYAKLPLGSDRYIWATSSTGIATNVNQLSRYPEVFGSISESVATWGGSYPRDYAHDVYKDVTTSVTEVVEGTPDDYTYTETETIETNVKATKDDYDFIIDKAYVLRRK